MILGIAGSIRKGSYNKLLLEAAVHSAPPSMEISLYDELAAVPLFSEDLEQGAGPEAVARLRRRVAAADGLLIATPEFNQSMPGVLKNAIDWLSRPGPETVLSGKPVAVIGASAGRWGTRLAQAALRQTLYAAEAIVLPRSGLYVRDAAGVFDHHGLLVDESIRTQLTAVLRDFERWIRTLTHASDVGG